MIGINPKIGMSMFIVAIIVLGYDIYINTQSKSICNSIYNDTYTKITEQTEQSNTNYQDCIKKQEECIEADEKLSRKYDSIVNSRKLNNVTLKYEAFGYQGMYYGDGYYCVWTEETDFADSQYAEAHEQCHAMIDKDYSHFCE